MIPETRCFSFFTSLRFSVVYVEYWTQGLLLLGFCNLYLYANDCFLCFGSAYEDQSISLFGDIGEGITWCSGFSGSVREAL